MVNRPKGLGTAHETDIVNWLRANGWRHATRRPLSGGKDTGDVRLSETVPFTIEAKTAKKTTDRMAVGTWLRELSEEILNSESLSGAVVYKQRGTTDVGKYVVLMRMENLNVLLTRAFSDNQSALASLVSQPKRVRLIPRYD